MDNRFIKGRPDITNSVDDLMKLYEASTEVVGWYAHPAEVRGPFCRYLEVSEVADEYKKYVASRADDAKYAAAAMNNLPHLIDKIKELENEIKKLKGLL